MKKFKIKIYDHSKTSDKDWKKSIGRVLDYLEKAGVEALFDIVKAPRRSPVFDPQPAKPNLWRVNKQWFSETFSKNSAGYDFVVAYFEESDWKKPFKKNTGRGQSVDQNYGVSEIAMCGSHRRKDRRQFAPGIKETFFVSRFLHEMCHGVFDHTLHVEDVTHKYHYERGDLPAAMLLWAFNVPQMSNREQLHIAAVFCIGKDASPNDVAPDELGCAETVNSIHYYVFQREIGGTVSTNKLYKALLDHPNFIRVDQPLPGDIVISPTGYGNGKLPNGHVGIVGEGGTIMSNDSFKGTFERNFTIASWKKRYVTFGGYPMAFYRRI